MERTKFTMVDTMRDVDYSEVEDFCNINDMKAPEEGSHECYELESRLKAYDWEDFVDNLKYTLKNEDFLVTGTLGLWNGRHDIYAQVKNGLYDAVMYCIGDSTLDVDVQFNDGVIEVNCHHHDGTNCFEIHRLPYLGKKEIEKEKYTVWGDDIQVKDWMLGKIKVEELF